MTYIKQEHNELTIYFLLMLNKTDTINIDVFKCHLA